MSEEKKAIPILTYWEGRGRAEKIRYILGCAGIKFEENYLRKRSDMVNIFPNLLFNQLPLLQIDGIDIIQTHAIIRYVADNYDLMPKSPKDRCRCNELWEGLRDYEGNAAILGYHWNTPDNQINTKRFAEQMRNASEKWIPIFAGCLKEDNGFLINSERPYVCDYLLYYILESIDEIESASLIIKKNSRIDTFLETMRNRPEVKEFLASSHVHGPTTKQFKLEVSNTLALPHLAPTDVVLTYWDGRGRAEQVRYILGCAGIQFTDNYMHKRSDLVNLFPNLLYNQVPHLKIDGIDIVQTNAIISYVAENYGLMPKSPIDRARCQEFWEGLRDFQSSCNFVSRNWHSPDNPEELKKCDVAIEKGLKKWIPLYSKFLSNLGVDGFLVSTEKPYVCDYMLYYVLECADEQSYGKKIIQQNPRMVAFLKTMRLRPEVKAFLSTSHVHGPTTMQYKQDVQATFIVSPTPVELRCESTSEEVKTWLLSDPTLAKYALTFEQNDINGQAFSKLTRKQAKNMGVNKTSDWVRLSKSVKKLQPPIASNAVLTYWEGRGRSEQIRYILGCAGIQFKDNYMRNRSDYEKLMPNLLFNQVPYLQIDGLHLVQTHAIIDYIAENYNLMPSNLADRCRCKEFWEGLRDLGDACNFNTRNWISPDNKPEELKKCDAGIEKGLKKWLPIFAKHLKHRFLIDSERPYLCDYMLYYWLECADELDYGKEIIQENPSITAFLKTMRGRSEVKAFLHSGHVHGPTTAQYKKEVISTLSPSPRTLYYFDGPGRAQTIRDAFNKGGVTFTDKRLTREEFGALKGDPSSVVGQRFGSVPIIESEGIVIAQSIALTQYAADLGINANVSPQQRAVDMQILATHADVQTAMYKCLFGDDKSKEEGKKALPGQTAKFLGGIERILPASGFVNGGTSPTMGDIAIHDLVESKFPGLIALGQSIDSYPKIKAVVEAVRAYQPSSKVEENKVEEKKYDGKPVLVYFDAKGRAELSRLCFHAGGIEFEDKRLTGEQFGALKGDSSSILGQRFGSVPIIQHDSLIIAQSMACHQYAADLGINANLTAEQRAVDVQILGAHADLQTAYFSSLFGSDTSKAKAKEALPSQIEKAFSAFERIYSNNGFLHGGSAPTLGDLTIYDLTTTVFNGVAIPSIHAYPKINAVVERVKNYKPLQKYLQSRGDVPTLYYFDGPGRAQTIRDAFNKGGVTFIDKRLTREEFGALKDDPSSVVGQRFGSVPIIKLEYKGIAIAQSIALTQYAADLGINANVSPQQRAVDMQLLGTHADVQAAMYKCLFGDDKSKGEGKKALPGQAAKFLGGIERILPANGFVNGGTAPTIGDIAIHNLVESKFPGLIALGQSIDSYPKTKAVVEAVRAYQPSSKVEEKKVDAKKYDGKPVLTYFNGPGRAELSRLCFHAGGIEFEDKRLTGEQFGALKGDSSSIVGQRFGSVPILQHDDLLIAQSMACAQYAADLGINANVTLEQRAVDVQILGGHAEVQSAMYKCLFGDDTSKAEGKKALPAAVDKFFSAFERIYPKDGHFLHAGEAPTLGDMCIFDLVTSKFPGVIALGQSIDKYKKVKAVVEKVKAYPPLQKYLKTIELSTKS